MTTIPFRCLVLEERNTLGQPDGPNRFKMHIEFVWQLAMIVSRNLGWHVTESVTAGQARAVAKMIDDMKGDRGWGIHMYFWGDPEHRILDQFLDFLRGGAFVIVQPGSQPATVSPAPAPPQPQERPAPHRLRVLLLDNIDALGRPEGQDRFRLNRKFWHQVRMMLGCQGIALGKTVSNEQAAALADLIRGRSWGRRHEKSVRALVKFLRAGGFVVVRAG